MSQESVEIVSGVVVRNGDADRAEAVATIDATMIYNPVEDGPLRPG